jgi:superfamily II DNA or RNA helicase/HKD family nuclease
VSLEDGIYDRLLFEGELDEVSASHIQLQEALDSEDLDEYLSSALQEEIKKLLVSFDSAESKLAKANEILKVIGNDGQMTKQVLRAIVRRQGTYSDFVHSIPNIPVSQLALLTNAQGEPAIGSELVNELASADRVDLLMSFIKVSGLRVLFDPLRELGKRGVKIRVLTSAYLGATDKKALDQLVADIGAEVRVDYLARQNRLHAKAWFLERKSGYSTAFIGSSNISNPALSSGVEWNVRLTQSKSPSLMAKFEATFETYWNGMDFESYDPGVDGDKLEEALTRASGVVGRSPHFRFSNLEIHPQLHQIQMLDDLEWERSKGNHNNLVVAATGSGKTVVAALDFKRFAANTSRPPTLLFVAHTKEILRQAQSTFAEVMRDSQFGEILADGYVPQKWTHIFATVQSLNESRLMNFDEAKFDYLVVDEVHHAEARSYKRIINKFKPIEFLGLTATPERNDGVKIQDELFGGKISSELRLWDALEAELLAPFDYFAIGEKTDFTKVSWSKGRYDSSQISNLLTGNTARDYLMFSELERKVPDLSSMRALFFCSDVKHAEYINDILKKNKLSSECVTGETSRDIRESVVSRMERGDLNAITAVDVFNEGFDLPAIDTLVMLRPTESPVLFLQQLGRGLRKFKGKESCLVLDFVGLHRAEYRLDRKFLALTGRARGHLKSDIESGFPFLPSGMSLNLDQLARENVLNALRNQLTPGRAELVSEVRRYGGSDLQGFLESAGRDASDIYRLNRLTWMELLGSAGYLEIEAGTSLFSSRIKNLLHINDHDRITAYKKDLEEDFVSWEKLSERERRFRNMFFWLLWRDGKDPNGRSWDSVDSAFAFLRTQTNVVSEMIEILSICSSKIDGSKFEVHFIQESIPLLAHANYSLDELLGAIGYARLKSSPIRAESLPTRSADSMRQGVVFVEEIGLDLLTVTLQKGKRYSSTTRYLDYAETRDVFHWESQSTTTSSSATGQRYITQTPGKSDVLLAIRNERDSEYGTQSYRLAGLADYLKHQGEKPISIWWSLRTPLEVQGFKNAAAVKVA